MLSVGLAPTSTKGVSKTPYMMKEEAQIKALYMSKPIIDLDP